MEKFSISVVYDHRGRTPNEKEGPLEVRITVGRKPYYVQTGVRVTRRQWAGAVVNRADADALNERLGLMVRKIQQEVNVMIVNCEPIDAAIIRERVWAKDEQDGSLLDWLEEQIGLLDIKESTRKHYHTVLAGIMEFGKLRNWRDLTQENIYAFDAWLRRRVKPQTNADALAGREAENICTATIYNYHKRLKALLGRAERMGKIERSPYYSLKGQFKRGDKEKVEFLTEEEMRAVMSIRPVPGTMMAVARDLFVFQMFTGMGYSDAQNFDIKKYHLVNGEWVSVGERVKTGVPFVSHLLPPAVEVLERYGMRIPKINNADYNHALKAIQMVAGISTTMHSHLARHTFATFMLRNGVELHDLAKMMGHTTTHETEKYAKVLAEDIHDDFRAITNKLKQERWV